MAERDAKRDIAKRLKEQRNIKIKKSSHNETDFCDIVNLFCIFSW